MTLTEIETRLAERDARILAIRKQARIDKAAQQAIINAAAKEMDRIGWDAQHAEDKILKYFSW